MLTLGYSFRPWAGTATLADGASIRGYLRDTPASAASTPRSATATAQVALYYRFTQRAPRLSRRLLLAGLRRQLPPGYPVQTHFHPSYDPWDQRLCLVPDGDLFAAIRAGRVSMVTDTIETFTETGIRLTSGAELDADVVVAATGLALLAVGGMALSVDGGRSTGPTRSRTRG